MTVTRITPEGLMQPAPYHHVSIATGTRHVHVAGQVARDAHGAPLADDLTGQVEHVLRNTAVALAGAGATFADVTRMRFFVVGWDSSHMAAFMKGVTDVADEIGLALPMPPASLIGVERLHEPDVLVELETDALLD